MSNNKQPVELTEITVSSPVATQGLTMEDRDVNQTPYYVDESYDESIGFLLECATRGRNHNESYESSFQHLPSICKVSRILRDHNESSFEPLLVSIGPIHRENKKLEEFERQKECYLNDLLNRCYSDSTPKETLEACLQKVNDLMPRIRVSYSDDVIKNYSDVELARMMVMDGCFILEFCFKQDDHRNMHLQMQNKRIAMDLVLLENQVPFIVLQDLFDCFMGKQRDFTLSKFLDTYLAPYIKLFCSKEIPTTDVDSDSTHDHVLGYLHRRYKLHHSIVELRRSSNREERIEKTAFPSIVELDRSGMKFKPHQEDEWSMTILFQSSLFADSILFQSSLFADSKEPTLLLPALVINDYTELILRNFIAYEQSFPHNRYHFTSYAVAMDTLIDTQDDIAKLAESKVLVNNLGSNQEAADMINKICKYISINIKDFYYTQAFKQMDKYYNSKWINHITQLKRVYFVDPWKAYALVYTSCVFVITVVQTYYTIKGK